MKILPENWGTDRLMVRDATMEDVPHLRNVFISILKAGTADRLSFGPRGRLATMIAVPEHIIARTVEWS
jgi:hypothetical protein